MGRRAFFSDLEKILAYHTNNENYRQKERAFQPERGRHLSQGQWQSFVKRICEILIEKKVEGKEEKKKGDGSKIQKSGKENRHSNSYRFAAKQQVLIIN